MAAISWNDYFWDVMDAVLASLGTDSYSFPSDFVRSVVDTEPSQIATEMARLGQKLYCTERNGVSLLGWLNLGLRESRRTISATEVRDSFNPRYKEIIYHPMQPMKIHVSVKQILRIDLEIVLQLSAECSDRVVCEHISTALDPSSSHQRRNILLRSGGLFLVTLAKWKGGSGMIINHKCTLSRYNKIM